MSPRELICKADDERKRRRANLIRREAATAFNTTKGNSALLMPLVTAAVRVVEAGGKESIPNRRPQAEVAYVKQLALSAKFYGVDITGLSVSRLVREISRCHVALSANSMKMAAESALRFVPADSQGADCARDVIADHAKFLQAFEASDAEAALRHFVDMHDVNERLGNFQILPYIKDGLKKWGKLKGKDKISKLSRGMPDRKQKARDRYHEECARSPVYSRKLDANIAPSLCNELRRSRQTLNDYLRGFDPHKSG